MISRFFLSLVLLGVSSSSFATDYVLQMNLPTCTSNNWSVTGNQYTCNYGIVKLAKGDTLSSAIDIQLTADGGFQFEGNNKVGDSSATIDLKASYGNFEWKNDSNNLSELLGSFVGNSTPVNFDSVFVEGSIETGGNIEIHNSNVIGSIDSKNNEVEITDSKLFGSITASNEVVISNSGVDGDITSKNSRITMERSEVEGKVSTKNKIVVEDSAVSGELTSTDETITIENSEVEGDVSTKNKIVIEGSQVSGDITSSSETVELDDSYVIGDVQAGQPNWGTVYVSNGTVVDGTCLYQTVPENACGIEELPNPIARYHLDEASWNGANNEVVDSSENQLHGQTVNGLTAQPSSEFSAIPTINSLGTCGFGEFINSSNQ